MSYNYDLFFNYYRKFFGNIKNVATVENLKLIIEAAAKYGATQNQLAYILATAYHETAHDFIPKYEYGTKEYFVRKYWLNSRVAKWLGNDDAIDAFECRGRGLVQITGEDNYIKFGIRDNPDKALEINTAIDIMYRGMLLGMFTGKKLSIYIGKNSYDFIKARYTVNGTDKNKLIASYADTFLYLLQRTEIK